MTAAPSDLVKLLEAVARVLASQAHAFDHPAFVALLQGLEQRWPGASKTLGMRFALSTALDRLGAGQPRSCPFDAEAAAARLEAAFAATSVMRVHLCPLDVADEFADVSFGPNAVCTLSAGELREIFAPVGPKVAGLDERLAEFRWLVVRETAQLESEPGQRGSPFLYINMGRDFAEIDPHERKFPLSVERALFALLLAPWEDLVDHADSNWRAFQIPWSYTVDDDLFVSPARLPSAETLSWDYDLREYDGETVEIEKPAAYKYGDPLSGVDSWVSDRRWREVETALASDLFTTPIVHFFVTAFLGTGIDEFMGHLTALDAALGLYEDRQRKKTLGARVEALLSDAAANATFSRLFELRSEYVHGRPMGGISGEDRNDARRLARRVANALVDRGQSLAGDRKAFLQSLAPSRP